MTDFVDRTQVVVVGAGLSGLTAARSLHRSGVDVVVVEAAERVGGRSRRETTSLGSYVDTGGQWVGHDHHRVRALAEELGLHVFPMHTGPMPVIVDGDRRLRAASPAVLWGWTVIGLVGALARVGLPRRRSTATVAASLRRIPGRTSRRLLEVAALVSWTFDLDRLSLTTMRSLINGQGGVTTMLSTKGGAQEALIIEGAGALAEVIAAELGDRVRTGAAVHTIERDDMGVTVHTSTGAVAAEAVIVSVPPPIAARITHKPALPADRTDLEQGTAMGSVYKAFAIYDQPFWRSGIGGELLVIDHPGLAVFDTTPPDGPGHLCLLVGGPEARILDGLDPRARRTQLLSRLAPHLGPEVLEPADWHEKAWHLDEHVGGGYLALPHIDANPSDLPMPMASSPVGRVHWAGAETAHDHPGYLDGAIEAGHRAAAEVAARLDS